MKANEAPEKLWIDPATDLPKLIGKDNGHLSEDELFRIAEYFYELGLKAGGEE